MNYIIKPKGLRYKMCLRIHWKVIKIQRYPIQERTNKTRGKTNNNH